MFTIRRAIVNDLDEFIELRLQLMRETGYLEGKQTSSKLVEATRAYLLTNLPTERFIAWVAEAESRIVGISGLVFFEKPPVEENLTGLEAYVMNMYTIPEWRGKGIAMALMQEIIHFVKTTGARRIWLHTTRDGQHVYEQSGFVFTADDMELAW
jgi:GNAT superfamily N-acetyltransferase